MPPLSNDNKKIIDYFTMENMKKFPDIGADHYQNNRTIKYLGETLENLKSFYEDYKKKYVLINENKRNYRRFRNQLVEKDINIISQKLEKFKYFYLPIVGMNNSGKSTILNDLIGYDLLPTGKDINTKKGILIKYCDGEPEINKVKFNYNSGKCFFTHEGFLGKGVQNVKKILKNINENFTDKEHNFFYEVYTKIKFIEENKYAQKLKDKICFIDLPGYATKFQFETKSIHSQLIRCCELVIFVFEIIKKGNNREYLYNIIEELKTIFRNEGSRTNAALQNRILFINNIFENNYNGNKFTKTKNDFEKEIEELKQKANNEIIDIFGKTFNESNVCVLNAQNYLDYTYNLNKFEQIYNFLDYELKKYERQKEGFYKGETNEKGVQKDFIEYLKKILEDELEKAKNLSTLSDEKIEKENISPKEMEQIEHIAKKYFGKDKKSKKFDKIVSIFSEIKKIANLYKFSIDLNNSYYERFSEDLKCFILFGEKIKNKNLIDNLNSILNRLNIIFFQPFKGKEPKILNPEETASKFEKDQDELQEIFTTLIDNMKNDLFNKEENNIPKMLRKSLDNLQQSLIEQKEKINQVETKEESNKGFSFFGFFNQVGEKVLNYITAEINWLYSNDWKIIQDKIKIIFQKEINNFKDLFKKGVYNYSEIFDKYYEKIKNIYNHYTSIFYKIFGEQHKKDLENIYNKINYKKFKDYIEKSFDEFNNKKLEDILEDIEKEIIEGTETSSYYENSPSFLNYIKKKISNSEHLYTIIDYINENASNKFNQFINDFEEISDKYLENFIDNIKFMKQIIEEFFLENLISLEKKIIDDKKLKNEEEQKKYNEEKKEWEKTCDDYAEIKNNFEIYISEIKDYLSENVEPGISGISANKELNDIRQENNPLGKKVIITIENNIISNSKNEQPKNNPPSISNDLNAQTNTRGYYRKNIFQQGNENINNLRIAKEYNQNQNINNYSKNSNIIDSSQTANNQIKNVKNNNHNNSRIAYVAQKVNIQPKNQEAVEINKDVSTKNVPESEFNNQLGNQDNGKTNIQKRYVRHGYRRFENVPESEYNNQAGNQDTGKTGVQKRYVRYGYGRFGKKQDNNA